MDLGKVSSMAGLACVTTLFLSLRLFSRHLIKPGFWWDDWLMVFSLACNLGALGVNISMVSRISDVPSGSPLPAEEIITVYKLLLASDMMYVSTLSLTKLSVLLMQYRIFDVARHFKRWVWVIGAFVMAWWIVVFLLLIFEACWPVHKRGNVPAPGHCASQSPAPISNSVVSIVGDMMLLVLPIPQIWGLKLRLMEKVCLTLIFCLGICVIATSIARLVVFVHNEQNPNKLLASMTAVIGWSDVEMSTGIICACLPALRPIIMRISKACPCIQHKPSSKHASRDTSNGTSDSSRTATIPSVCQQRLSVGNKININNNTAVNRQNSHDRLYYGPEHDLHDILCMDDELSLEHTGGSMSMSIMPIKHEFGEVGTAV